MTWYHPGFAYKKALSIPASHVNGGSDLPDFPLLVSLLSPDLCPNLYGGLVCSPIGADLLFTDADERRELAYEVENYDPSIGSLLCWVRVPVLSAHQDTVIYLYFGNSTVVASLANPIGVWDSHYASVWHLADGTHLEAVDSITQNAGYPMTALATTGQIGGGAFFTGSMSVQGLNPGNLVVGASVPLTLSCWAKRGPIGTWQTLLSHGEVAYRDYALMFSGGTITDPSNYDYGLCSTKDVLCFVYMGSSTYQCYATSLAFTDTSNWHYYCVTSTYGSDGFGAGASLQVYVDGVPVSGSWTVGNGSDPRVSFENLSLGQTNDGYDGLYGDLDEARVSNVTRSNGWIATEYVNQKSPFLFLQVGETISYQGNIEMPVIVAYGVTTAQTSSVFANSGYRGVVLSLNVLKIALTGSLIVTLLSIDEVSGNNLPLTSFIAAGIGTQAITFYPGANASSLAGSDTLPCNWYVNVTPDTDEDVSYTVSASLIR